MSEKMFEVQRMTKRTVDEKIGKLFREWLADWGPYVTATGEPLCFFCKALFREPHFETCIYIRTRALIKDADGE